MLRLKEISINNIGGISDAHIPIHSEMNVICGPNGIGKTTILDVISHMTVVYGSHRLKKRSGSKTGSASCLFHHGSVVKNTSIQVEHFEPEDTQHYHSEDISPSDILYIKNYRLFDWQKLSSISSDLKINPPQMGARNISGIPTDDAKNWFVNRYLYSAHKGALSKTQTDNFKLARTAFAVLDPKTQFQHVSASTNEVIISTPKGPIPYEYLSSGFKTIISIFWGIIREIEFRKEPGSDSAKNYDGIILIDELELHLHPVWQSKILESLKKMFPSAQFIITTHSPHIVQSAENGEVLALEVNLDGETRVRELPDMPHGMRMWTVEEVLEDVMGMPDIRTDIFNGMIKNFQDAISREDALSARKVFDHLSNSLHPKSEMRKILSLQIASVQDSEID